MPGRQIVRQRATRNLSLEMGLETLRAKEQVEKAGLYLPDRPVGPSPALPADPSRMGDGQLMRALVLFTAWADYSAGQLALAEVEYSYADQALTKASDFFLLLNMPSGESVRRREDSMTRVKAAMSEDATVVSLRGVLAEKYAYRKLLSSMFERYVRDEALLSRELTRRTSGGGRTARRVAAVQP